MARNKFDVDEELEQEFSWKDFKRLARYVVPYKASIGKVLFTIILANLAGMLAPVFTKIAIDSAIPDHWTVHALPDLSYYEYWPRRLERHALRYL